MYLVANDIKLTIELYRAEKNKLLLRYYYESDLDYTLGLYMLLLAFEF